MFGKKGEKAEVTTTIAERIYLIPDGDFVVKPPGTLKRAIKEQLAGTSIIAGQRVEIDDPTYMNFPEDFLEKAGGVPKLGFKVWRTDPEGEVVISQDTQVIIVRSISYSDIDTLKDKCFGILVLLQEEASMPVGYEDLKKVLGVVTDIENLDVHARAELLRLIYDIEGNCLEAILKRGRTYLGVKALECLHELRGVVEGRNKRN